MEKKQLLGADRDKHLARLGFRNLRDLLDYEPVQSARTLTAVARGLIPKPQLAGLVKEEFIQKDAAEALSWPVTALHNVEDVESEVFGAMGVTTIGDLALLAKEADELVLATLKDNGFRERPSAPAQLLPGIIGSVASSIRFTSFIRDVELRKLTFKIDQDCIISLPFGNYQYQGNIMKGAGGSLAEIFLNLKCPVVHFGYMCDHRQKWINLGTHLGEVVHSLSLAPGESRNIALVNWRRRQLTALEERTTTSERLTATFVQNRALEEITSAVAREHQAGRTQTEANTSVTAASFVASGAAVGGGAGALIGTLVEPGGGTLVGAAVGAGAGVVAGGLVYAGSQALGMIEADTEGDREIVADVQQRISLSTSQTASTVRSLWSTVVVEDSQAENVEATTSNVTNYNHMHALNIEYYEVLQHYLTRIDVERVQPILFLPFTFFDFTNLRFVRDYWEGVRQHIDDEDLQAQGDAYFVTEGPPDSLDLLPVPPLPTPPSEGPNLKLQGLQIDFIWKAGFNITDIDLEVLQGNVSITPIERDTDRDLFFGLDWDEGAARYIFSDIGDAGSISGVRLEQSQFGVPGDIRYRIKVHLGTVKRGASTVKNLAGQDIVINKIIKHDDEASTFDHPWTPVAAVLAENDHAWEKYNADIDKYNDTIAINGRRRAAHEALVENHARFVERLQRLVLRRRHFFTRVILNAIEPEEINQLLEALRIGHTEAGNSNFGIPLSEIAHTIPIGMTTGGFVLKLKRLDKERLHNLAQRLGMDKEVEELVTLLQYAHQTLSFFEDTKCKEAMARTDHVYVPTGGLFAEAILGRANSAEYLDMERYFNWQDSPIPHLAPTIQPVGTESRFQQGDVSVNVPEGNLQVINPVNLPDPTGLQGVLTAIQNPNLFRDMSKTNELVGMIGSLSTLAGQMGQVASNMTGQAAQQALQAATEASKVAAGMAQTMMNQAFTQAGGTFNTLTSQGAALNQAEKINATGASAPSAGAPSAAGGTGAQTSPLLPLDSGLTFASGTPSLQEETFRRMAALDGSSRAAGIGGAFTAPDLTVPGDQVSPFLWRDLIEFQVPQDVLDILTSRGMSSLSLGGAAGALVNLDYFPVHVTKLPVVDDQQLTAEQFLEFIRRNLHSNLLISTALGKFAPYTQEDEQIWFSDNPYRSVLRIDLLGPDNAAVVCAESAADRWIFHTVATPDTGAHPVSGQRMFGYWSPASDEFVFYTRGADRATGIFDSFLSEQIFGGGAAIWATFQAGVAGFVNSNGGEATVPRAFSGRFSWFNLIGVLRAQAVTTTPI